MGQFHLEIWIPRPLIPAGQNHRKEPINVAPQRWAEPLHLAIVAAFLPCFELACLMLEPLYA